MWVREGTEAGALIYGLRHEGATWDQYMKLGRETMVAGSPI